LLAGHPSIVIGAERYITRAFTEGLGPHLFTEERFFNIQPGDTFYSDFAGFNGYYEEMQARYDQAVWVGDKSPPFYYLLDSIEDRFDDAHVIIIARDVFEVAASYQARANNDADLTWSADRDYALGVKEWNDANHFCLQFLQRDRRCTGLTIVDYADIFGRKANIEPLFTRLGLNCPDEVHQRYRYAMATAAELSKSRKCVLAEDQVRYVRRNADFKQGRRLLHSKLRLQVLDDPQRSFSNI
jgi:hypothetical protein